ncbi:MAG: DUF503 domain-containing protein [Candidatus Atribacteria bacterium]|nr:DUF503 domain-containing protein [Candidatus Atribacteria bacterium]
MLVGLCKLAVYLPNCHSLKDKRSLLESYKIALRKKYNISISEIGKKNLWKNSIIGIALIGNDRQLIDQVIDKIIKDIEKHPDIQLQDYQISIN